MFEALKKKFASWFGKKEEPKQEEEKPEEKAKEETSKTPSYLLTIEGKKEEEEAEEKPGFFSRLIKKIIPAGTTTLEKKHIDEIFMELELTLLENNVALEVVDKIRENLYKDLLGIEVRKQNIEQTITKSLKNSILEVLMDSPNLEEQIKFKKTGPFVIVFFGINGSGKTTTIAKAAYQLQKKGFSCVLAAADTFRAASIEQLEKHGKNLDIQVIKQKYGADPAAVAFDAVKYAQAHKIQVVLIDTAGRMYTKTNLVKEMEKIIRVIKPDLKIFVGE